MLDERRAAADAPARAGWHRFGVAALACAAAALYAACAFRQYLTFRAGTYDLVIFDQAVRSYSRFHLPVSLAKAIHNGFGTGFSVLGDHFSPILALLAPLYWLHDGPATLLVAQSVLFASAVAPLWVFARRELGPAAAYLVAAGYAVSWPVAQAVSFDFHEVAFAPLLTAVLFERHSAYRRGDARWWHVALAAGALLTVKEDLGLLVAGFGLAVLGFSPRTRESRLLASAFVVVGLAAVFVTTRVVLPAFGGRAGYYWRYGRFGPTVPSAVGHIVADPLGAARTFVTPDTKADTMIRLGALAAFAPLASPYVLAVLPLLAERMLADAPNWWGVDFHYNAYLVVPLLCAGVDGAARVGRLCAGRFRAVAGRLGLAWAGAVLVLGVLTVPSFAFAPVFDAASWQRDATMRVAADAVAHVPSGVTVEVVDNLGPQLSGRDTVLLWDRLPRWAPWVVADTGRADFPFCDLTEQLDRIAFLTAHGYRIAYQTGQYVVLHQDGPPGNLNTAPSPSCP